MHPGSIEYTQRVLAWSILLDETNRGLVEIFAKAGRSFCSIRDRSLRELRTRSDELIKTGSRPEYDTGDQ
jgi:hypothetical protein